MKAPSHDGLNEETLLAGAIEAACARIAPTWPLDRFIAVNPWWGHVDQPFEAAGGRLARLAGARWHMPLPWYRSARRRGEIGDAHLSAALEESGHPDAAAEAVIDAPEPDARVLPLLSDLVDSGRDLSRHPAWSDTVLQQVTQHCASYFDRDQADWHPALDGGLYATWRAAMGAGHTVDRLMCAPEIRERAAELPATASEAIAHAVRRLGVPENQLPDWLHAVLLRVGGWASWCAYLRWQSRLAGEDDDHIVELLAARAAWEALLDDGERGSGSVWARWQAGWDAPCEPPALPEAGRIWQRAQELAYQEGLIGSLTRRRNAAAGNRREDIPGDTRVQAVFCIDVRSEVYRRAIESVRPSIETKGFAGFFGLPVSYTPIGTDASRPQLPGLLAAAMQITDSTGDPAEDHRIADDRRRRLRASAGWRDFLSLPASAFTLVESLGIGYLGKILRRCLPRAAESAAAETPGLPARETLGLRPRLAALGAAERTELAAGVLKAMSLTEDHAPLVLLVGHGSRSANNPHAAGLDCGACCGQTGEANARALADLLNDPAVRTGLAECGIRVPAETVFVAALHNTTTDDIEIFDADTVPAALGPALAALRNDLAEASHRARAERAPALGLGELAARPAALATAVRRRADDWSLTRPEWGLADNAAFVVGPRSLTRDVDLAGRAFLHDYDWRRDEDGSVLELIMTAPMVVTHWINMQYYASTVDNQRYGSGNKVLHNVVGGRIGVFEGNGGDLRIGLPLQSVHDGRRWMHTPIRLSVFIEAPRRMIDEVIARHEIVRKLLENRWLYLFRTEDGAVEAWRQGRWVSRIAT